MTSPINRTIRNARRASEFLSVMIRYGFQDFVHETNLYRLIDRGKRLMGRKRAAESVERLPRAVRLRRAMEELGPTFIKLGQVLSTRPDLVPAEWAKEFEGLQSDCPRVEFSKIQEVLTKEFPDGVDKVFAAIEDEPLAAGSVAQAHRAMLQLNGQLVVIKVLRPGIHDIVEADMEILEVVAEFVESKLQSLGYSPTEVIREFRRQIVKEMDLTIEARATARLRDYFGDDDRISFPKVYWEATTERVLTLEEVKGDLLSSISIESLERDERTRLVECGVDAVFKQCFELGFFHADPHPGNIFVLGNGRVCFIDCGMTGRLDRQTADRLADLVYGTVVSDLDRVIAAVIGLTDIDPSVAEGRPFRTDVWDFMSHFEGGSFDQIAVGSLLRDFFEKLRAHGVRCPSDLVFLIKAITTIEGVGARIAPWFDIIGYARPHIEVLFKRRYGIRALRQRMRTSLMGYGELVEVLPRELHRLLEQLWRSRFSVHLEHTGLEELRTTIGYAIRTISYALMVSALIVGSSILALAERASDEPSVFSILAFVGFGAAGLLSMLMVFSNFRNS